MRYCADTQQRIAGDMSSHRLEGPRWALRFNIMSQRKKGCESLTYPFPGFNFYIICLSTTYTCQDNVSRLVLDSVEAWLSGLKRQLIGKVFERTFAGSNPAASVESSAIHSLVFRLRHRKADGMVIPILQVGMSWFDP